jgi:molybdopterin-guanine dinucleotide biosynthesis protein A
MPVAAGCVGLVLAGGHGHRLFPGGHPHGKAGVEWAGRSFLASVCDALVSVAERVVVVTGPGMVLPPDAAPVTVVHDACPDAGPLAALADGLEWIVSGPGAETVVVTAVDLPLLAPAVLLRLLHELGGDAGPGAGPDWVVPVVDGHRQVLLSALRPRLLPAIRRYLATGRRDPRGLVAELLTASPGAVRLVAGDGFAGAAGERLAFFDVDRPEDLDHLRGLGGRGPERI